MDIATRFQPRARVQTYLDREREHERSSDVSSNESESLTRRKFQRSNAAETDVSDETFRKPSIPASAARASTDQRPSFTHRRRSTLRDNARVPSGPREQPSPTKRVASGSSSASARAPASMTDTTNNSHSFLADTTTEPFYSKSSFADPSSNASIYDASYPTTPATNTFDFIPTVNFDDFQNSIASYGGTSPLLSDFPEFPTVGSGRAMPKEVNSSAGAYLDRPPVPKLEPREGVTVGRSGSLRNRLGAAPGAKQGASQSGGKESAVASSPANSLTLRTKRQSAVPQGPPAFNPAPPPLGAGARAPRKSIGPGVIATMMEGRKTSQPMSAETPFKSNLGQTGSTANKASRRITMQPTVSTGAEPRISTLTATTQSRANKVKSLQAPPRESEPGTPSGRAVSKGTQNRAHTPSSSGSKRQSTASGRASGLGARTISPTDARRLKRLSMMQAPPMPTNLSLTKDYPMPERPMPDRPMPQDDFAPLKLELPRFTQASPSLIPRKTSSVTPTSARASPDLRGNHTAAPGGGVTLSTKSSFSSLLNLSGSTSRLPTPKSRNVHSSSAQYGEDEEIVPPVPAIPKAFESPRENDQVFFATTSKADTEREAPLPGLPGNLPKPNRDVNAPSRRKPSSDSTRAHQRTNTFESIERCVNVTAPKPSRHQQQQQQQQQFDNNGRKNSNLQPLRLPPLNLMPINATKASRYQRPSHDGERPEESTIAQTPEPKRTAKTPSTPMTASKATFYRRQEEDPKPNAIRSASSHFALRDMMQKEDSASRFFDDSELDLAGMGMPIPPARQRNAITPFSSGSLPKASGEFIRQQVRASGDDDDYSVGRFEGYSIQGGKPQGPRTSRSGTVTSITTSATPTSLERSAVDPAQPNGKKEGGGSAIRRKLSMGWHRASSKATNSLSDHKSSPAQDGSSSEQENADKQKKRASQMPPPKLPASATWTGDVPSLPATNSARASLDSARGKITAPGDIKMSPQKRLANTERSTPAAKTKSIHGEQPQPVNTANRASSWGQIGTVTRSTTKAPTTKPRNTSSTSSFSAKAKDKDDLAADEEMRRLSQKRRDVDTAAKESEELKRRAVARSAMTPENVLHDRNCTLNIFERGEIMDYGKDGVYFTGNKNARKIIGALTPSPQPPSSDKDKAGNYGYDDERGDYNIVMGDHLAYRYEVVDLLGKGSFGQVVRCVDHKDGGVVAVKIIRNKKRFHQQALVEVGILGRLRDWDPEGTQATLSITSSFYFRSHLCIVTPCLSINLYELIRSHNFVGFSLPLIRRFSRQLLSCLVLLQNKRIIHCDLKPENILLCEARKADVRVIDFGSSCKEEEKVYTYIQSRFYRSPEVILGSSYGLGIDMWSLGCILAELWTGYPLFPGENEQEQLACIMEIFGPPDRHLVERCTRKKLFFDSVGKPRVTVSSKGRRRRPSSKTLSQALKTEDEAFLDFISRCLRWDPERRLKPHEAIHHAFVTNQPFHQRPGIPDEARRAARVRAAAAVPTSTGNNIPSPVKRGHTTAGSISHTITPAGGQTFASQQATPAKERHRPLPETPQTALRNGGTATQGSPVKQPLVAGPRRQSAVVSAGATNIKRSSQGLAIGMQRQGSGIGNLSGNNPSLAQLAAREASAARWRG